MAGPRIRVRQEAAGERTRDACRCNPRNRPESGRLRPGTIVLARSPLTGSKRQARCLCYLGPSRRIGIGFRLGRIIRGSQLARRIALCLDMADLAWGNDHTATDNELNRLIERDIQVDGFALLDG